LHQVGDYKNCYSGNQWDATLCSTPEECAKNCALEGADYQGTYGITTSADELQLKLVTQTQYGTNVGSRVYLMDADGSKYKQFKLLNQEFTLDVDVSKLPCGLNGALYFVQMDADGGSGRFPSNKAGANYDKHKSLNPVPFQPMSTITVGDIAFVGPTHVPSLDNFTYVRIV
ncbi:Glycosyl hydrolase, partial [Phytophthora megakarya]